MVEMKSWSERKPNKGANVMRRTDVGGRFTFAIRGSVSVATFVPRRVRAGFGANSLAVAAAPSAAGPVLKPLIKPGESRGDLQRSKSHVLAAGETLGAVAARYRVPVADLRRVNHVKDDRKLVVGQVIVIPGPARP